MMKHNFVRKKALLFLLAAICIAAMPSCTIQPLDRYAGLSDLSVSGASRENGEMNADKSESSRRDISVTELPATFSEAEYIFDPNTGKYVTVSTPKMYSSKIPDVYVVSQKPSDPESQSSQSSASSQPPKPVEPTVPTTDASGSEAQLTSAQRQKIMSLISADLLDGESFENSALGINQIVAAGLLLGRDDIVHGFDDYISKDILSGYCKDIFGEASVLSGSKLSCSYISLKGDKCYIKKMPETNGYSKSIEAIYDVGNGYYKVAAQLYSGETKKGNAAYIIKANSASTYGFVIMAQKIY